MAVSTVEDYNTFIAGVGEALGMPGLAPEGDGVVSLELDGRMTLNLRYVPETSSLALFTEVMPLPEGTPEAVYRAILSGMLFGRETADGTLALEPSGGTLVYSRNFEFTPASDPAAFVELLEKVLALTDMWRERLERLTAEASPSATAAEGFPSAGDVSPSAAGGSPSAAEGAPQEAMFRPSELFMLRP